MTLKLEICNPIDAQIDTMSIRIKSGGL